MASFDHRYDSGHYLRRVIAVPRAQSRMTVSASTPMAVLSITIFRVVSRVLVGCDLLLVPAGGLSNSRVDQDPLLLSESLHWRNLALGHDLADFHFTKHGSAQVRDFLIDLLKRMLRELLRW